MKNARITAQRFLLRLPNGRHVLGSESQHGACREMQEAVRIKSSCKEKLGILEKSEIWTFLPRKAAGASQPRSTASWAANERTTPRHAHDARDRATGLKRFQFALV